MTSAATACNKRPLGFRNASKNFRISIAGLTAQVSAVALVVESEASTAAKVVENGAAGAEEPGTS